MDSFIDRVPTSEESLQSVLDLLRTQAESVSSCLDQSVAADIDRLARLLVASPCVIVAGMGKSGCVARLFSELLQSTKTRAFYVDPASALHGGLAVLQPTDLVVLVSKSGETSELLQLAAAANDRGCLVLSVTESKISELADMSHATFIVPRKGGEVCPTGLIPVTSTAAHTAFLNVVVARVSQLSNIAPSEVVDMHPSGNIGKLKVCNGQG